MTRRFGGRTAWLTAGLLALGIWLRVTGLSVHSLWLDEGAALYAATASDVFEVLRADRHPPLSFLALRWWVELGGQSDGWLRLLPAMLSSLSLVLFWVLARRLLEPEAALWALAIYALSPFHVWHGQEVRMYAFVELGALLAFLGVAVRGRASTAALCAAGAFLAAGSHYLGGLAAPAALGLALWLTWRDGSSPREIRWSALGLFLGIWCWVPWTASALPTQLDTDWGHQHRTSARDLLEFPVRQILVELDVLEPRLVAAGYAAGAATLIALALALWTALRQPRSGSAAAGLLLAIPIALALSSSLVLPANFLPKYLMAASPGTALLVAAGIARARPRWLSLGLATAVLGPALLVTLLLRQANHREDYRGACADLVRAWTAGDAIVVVTGTPPGFSEAPVRHYLRGTPLADHVRDFATFQRERPSERRVHAIYRSAKYAESQIDVLWDSRPLIEKSPGRFRVQWLLFGPETGAAEPTE
jgi:4-amino-4-deoxy-L-arabinose transferase-like glycosyltransferase